jgi:hypothetical protein
MLARHPARRRVRAVPVSGIPVLRDAEGWNLADVIGDVAWFGFVLAALAFLVSAVYVAVRGLRARSAA